RIHSLTISSTHLNSIGDRVIQAFISASSPTPLLPNLRNLGWWDDQQCFFPLLRTLFGPTITSMGLGFTTRASSFAISTLVASLGACCPSIHELHCEYSGDSQESSDAICEALCGLRELFRLGIGVLNAQMLFRLASLSSLKFLSLNLRMYSINHTHSVGITAPSPFVLTHCLRNIRFLSCRSVIFHMEHGGSQAYDPRDIPDLIITVSECFPPTLEKLHFDFDIECRNQRDLDNLADPSFAFDFGVVAPMLSFSHLKYFNLDWICTSAINDTSLKTMAQSAACWMIPPSLTFIGLVHLIHQCPLLRIIEMPFCAYPVDVNSAPFSNTNPNEEIRELFVGMSPIVDPVTVACQLHKLMPKLVTVGFYDWYFTYSPVAPPLAEFDGDWNEVNDFLQEAQK
ncbi:hypothetical protein BD769DRAFT_1503726, partial [Suillus cothurnatus]